MKKKILLVLSMLAFVVCLFAISVSAAEAIDVNGKGIWYELDSTNKTAKVAIDNATKCTLTDVVIPDTFEYNGVTYTVTSVASRAFSGDPWGQNQTIKSLVIPESVTSIGDHILRLCTSIETVVINAKATQLYDAQFYGCSNLKSVDMSNSSIKSFGKGYTFQGCSSLVSVKFPQDLGMTSIPVETFKGCSSLTSIEIPDTVTAIGSWAFNGCVNLANVKLPSALTSIEANAFQNCKSFTSVVFPNNSIKTAKDIFNSCSALKFVILPSDVSNFTSSLLSSTNVTVVIYPGANASDATSKISALSGHTAVPFSEYDPNATYTTKTIFYGATTCSSCNGLLGEKGFIFKDLLTEMNVGQECTYCGKGNYTETYAPVFVDLGYSVFELDGRCSIMQGFKVDYDSFEIYNENCEAKLDTFGVLAVADRRVENVAFDENGIALTGVLKYEVKSGHDYFEIKIANIPANEMLDEETYYADAKFHLCAYVTVGDEIYYISEKHVSTVLGESVSYNEKVEK